MIFSDRYDTFPILIEKLRIVQSMLLGDVMMFLFLSKNTTTVPVGSFSLRSETLRHVHSGKVSVIVASLADDGQRLS